MKRPFAFVLIVTLIFDFLTAFSQVSSTRNFLSLWDSFPIPRIIGGVPANEGQFPWHVILKRYEVDKLWCGGSIISEDWILTAAHCIDGFSTIIVGYGTIHLNTVTKIMKSSVLIKHPMYNPQNYNYDIGLIRLPKSLEFSNNVNKIQLVPRWQAGNSFTGQITYVTGFGYTSDEIPNFSNDLLYTNMQVISNSDCEKIYDSNVIIRSTMCAKGAQSTIKNICGGDSGGAMIMEQDNNFIQIGINSFVATDGCEEDIPSGFTRVGSLLDYISQVTGIVIN